MSSFDPYHFWLSIPPEHQPPNHYRLLGLSPFESDPDVIDNAADQRMAFLRTKQTGDRAEHGQRLLNEVSAARTCLLNSSAKAAYDESLKAKEQASQLKANAIPLGRPAGSSLADLPEVPLDPLGPAPGQPAIPVMPVPQRHTRPARGSSGLITVAILLGGGLFMIVCCGGMIWYGLNTAFNATSTALDQNNPMRPTRVERTNPRRPIQPPAVRPTPPPRFTPNPAVREPANPPASQQLVLVETAARPELRSISDVSLGAASNSLWTAAWNTKTICRFQVDPQSGRLTHTASLMDDQFNGSTGVTVTPSGDIGVVCAFRSKTVSLVYCDTSAKTLEIVSQFDGSGGELDNPINSHVSEDGRFVYVFNKHAIVIFKISGQGKSASLELMTTFKHASINDSRDMAFDDVGGKAYICTFRSDTLLQVDWDPQTGQLTNPVPHVNGRGGLSGLDGVFGAAIDSENRRLYTVSGRFGGEQAVCSFELGARLRQISVERPPNFDAGNKLAVDSQRGLIYATASNNGAVAVYNADGQGRLTLRQLLLDPKQCAGGAGVSLSEDRRFLYIADEKGARVSVFKTP